MGNLLMRGSVDLVKLKSAFKGYAERGGACVLVLFVGLAACMAVISRSSPKVMVNEQLDTRPTVVSVPVTLTEHQTHIPVTGVLEPAERTDIAFELSGKIAWLNSAFIEGGVVENGTLLATLEPFDYETQVVQRQAELSLAQANLALEIARAQVAEVESANNPQITALALRKPQVDSAKAQVQAASANLAQAQKNLERTRYYAPYDLLIIGRRTGLGQVISKGEALGQAVSLSYGEIRVPIAGFDRPFLPELPATGVTVFTQASSRTGTLTRHTGQFNDKTRMAYYVVRIDDPYGINTDVEPLFFGQFLQARIAGKRLSNVLKVPQELVRDQAIWLVDQDQALVQHPVTVVRNERDYALLEGGQWIDSNYRMLSQLPDYPQPGMLVRDEFQPSALSLNRN